MARTTGREAEGAMENRRREEQKRRNEVAAENPRSLNIDSQQAQRRNEIASALLSFYEFLTRTHIPAEALKRPPKGGWPFISAERFDFLGKTDAVIDLYKHIPYISQEAGREDYEVGPRCVCVDYTGDYVRTDLIEDQKKLEPPEDLCEDEEAWPPLKELQHVAILAMSNDSSEGLWMAVDTRTGSTVRFHSFPDMPPSWTKKNNARELLERFKEEHRNLTCLAISPFVVVTEHGAGRVGLRYGEESMIKDLYRKYGWPSDAFRKDECLRAIEQALQVNEQKHDWEDMDE